MSNNPIPAEPDTTRNEPAITADKSPAHSPAMKQLLPIFLICLLGLAVRLVGLRWSLPTVAHPFSTYHPDEVVNLGVARTVNFIQGKIDIKYYNYGSLYFYLVSVVMDMGKTYGFVSKLDPASSIHSLASHMDGLFMSGRLVSFFAGIFTIPVVYAIGKRLESHRIGLYASLLFAITPLSVVDSDFFTVDSTGVLFVALALLYALKMYEGNTLKQTIVAGVWVGLASATKYNLGMVLIAPVLALMLGNSKSRLLMVSALLLSSIFSFLIACPGCFLHFQEFWYGIPGNPQSGLAYELFVHSRTGHGLLFVKTGPGWWYHLVVSLPWGLGILMEIGSICGLLFVILRRKKADLILGIFVVVFFLLTSLSAVRFARYMLPLFPVFAVMFTQLCFTCKERYSRQGKSVFVLVLLATGIYTFSLVRCMATTPPQDSSASFIRANVPLKGTVAFASLPWFYSPPLSPLFGAPDPANRKQAAAECKRFTLVLPFSDWDESVLSPTPDAVVVSNFETMHPLRLHQKPTINFMNALKAYRSHVFSKGTLWGSPPQGVIIPDDILYICPTITVYTPFNK